MAAPKFDNLADDIGFEIASQYGWRGQSGQHIDFTSEQMIPAKLAKFKFRAD
jgi:hypothetical protein